MSVLRNEIWFTKLGIQNGSIQGGTRPVYIIQNDVGNKFSTTTIVAPITSKMSKNKLPTHILISPEESGLKTESLILCEQIKTINQDDLFEKVGTITDTNKIAEINKALRISMKL